jgi:hypothetical protein
MIALNQTALNIEFTAKLPLLPWSHKNRTLLYYLKVLQGYELPVASVLKCAYTSTKRGRGLNGCLSLCCDYIFSIGEGVKSFCPF